MRWRFRDLRPRALTSLVAAAVVVVDQVSKTLAQDSLRGAPVHLLGPFYLRLEYNPGFAFSLGQGLSYELAALAAIVGVGCLVYSRRTSSFLGQCTIGLFAGGVFGNLADRVFRGNAGSVIDFLYSGFWPTFNLADASIVIGAILWVIVQLRSTPTS